MRILILNWRDIKNPRAGGAEVLTHEMARRWVAWGHTVMQISGGFAGAKKEEIVDGVLIIRKGMSDILAFGIPVQLAAYIWFIKQKKNAFDVVIDEIHGIPFFSPLYVRNKKVALICEVADEIWHVIFKFPLNIVGKFIERNSFRFYKNVPFLAISQSTKKDLLEMGVDESHITVLPMGVSAPSKIKSFPKEKKPTIIFLGRLLKTKGVEDAIGAFEQVSKKRKNAVLWIVGKAEDDYQAYLSKRIEKSGVGRQVKFFGFVNTEKKFELLTRAHILIVPSVKEGWGLIVAEAGLCKTPSVVYDVSGLRDIVTHGLNGLIVPKNTRAMAAAVEKLFQDKAYYNQLALGAYHNAKTHNWDNTAAEALAILENQR